MQISLRKTLFLLLPFLSLPLLSSAQLTLEINSIKEYTGEMYIAVYNSEESFLDESKMYRQKIVAVEGEILRCDFPDLPSGQYAIAIYHDKNSNEQFDTNFMGLPKEGYGFSNDVMGRFGPPSFSAASFNTTSPNEAKTVHLRLK